MQNNISIFAEKNSVSFRGNHSCFFIILEYNCALGRNSNPSVFEHNYCFMFLLLFILAVFVVVYFCTAVLTEKFVFVNSENQVVFDWIEQVLAFIACTAFLADYNSPILSTFQGETSRNFFNIANFFIVKVIELRIGQIVIIIFKILEPRLVVRHYLPTTLPSLLGHPPSIILVNHHQIQFVSILIVFRKSSCFVYFCCLEQLSLEGVKSMLLLVYPVGEWVGSFLVVFFYVLLEICYPLSSEKLVYWHVLEKLCIMSQLQFS